MSYYSHLLPFVEEEDSSSTQVRSRQQRLESFENTPIYTSAVGAFVESTGAYQESTAPQYSLLGIQQDDRKDAAPEDRLVLANMNIPWSAFICGSQGSGKSHTLSCLLEGALIANSGVGTLPSPLAGMVMHYDCYANHGMTQLCEAAYLCSSGIIVNVLVSPSNIWDMTALYAELPGLPANTPRPKILPLYFNEDQLDVSNMLKLMALDPTDSKAPLYMEVVTSIIREMAMEGPGFSYSTFRQRLNDKQWLKGQDAALNMRLDLLDSFMAPSSTTRSTRAAAAQEDIWAFEPGTLTIIDLSDPSLNSNSACSLFSICLSAFLERRDQCAQVVALDEAHKFLVQSGEARILTEDLTSIVRQQRHTGTHVIIATQEPTLSPGLIDLANATFVHRFLSPAWYDVLKKHLAGANPQEDEETSIFETIVALRTGEALLFCPTAQMSVDQRFPGYEQIHPLGNEYAKIKIRKRLTADGGKSMTAMRHSATASKPLAIDVPMYTVGGSRKCGRAPEKDASDKKDDANSGVQSSESVAPAAPAGTQPGTGPRKTITGSNAAAGSTTSIPAAKNVTVPKNAQKPPQLSFGEALKSAINNAVAEELAKQQDTLSCQQVRKLVAGKLLVSVEDLHSGNMKIMTKNLIKEAMNTWSAREKKALPEFSG